MRFFKLALAFLCLGVLSLTSLAQSARTPAPGSEERVAIMEALRVRAKKDFGRTVIFKVNQLRVAGAWAFARVVPTMPDGSEIDFSTTKYKEQMDEDAFDPQGDALLRSNGGEWRIVEWVFGATDVPSVGWAEKHRLPKSLLE